MGDVGKGGMHEGAKERRAAMAAASVKKHAPRPGRVVLRIPGKRM